MHRSTIRFLPFAFCSYASFFMMFSVLTSCGSTLPKGKGNSETTSNLLSKPNSLLGQLDELNYENLFDDGVDPVAVNLEVDSSQHYEKDLWLQKRSKSADAIFVLRVTTVTSVADQSTFEASHYFATLRSPTFQVTAEKKQFLGGKIEALTSSSSPFIFYIYRESKLNKLMLHQPERILGKTFVMFAKVQDEHLNWQVTHDKDLSDDEKEKIQNAFNVQDETRRRRFWFHLSKDTEAVRVAITTTLSLAETQQN